MHRIPATRMYIANCNQRRI